MRDTRKKVSASPFTTAERDFNLAKRHLGERWNLGFDTFKNEMLLANARDPESQSHCNITTKQYEECVKFLSKMSYTPELGPRFTPLDLAGFGKWVAQERVSGIERIEDKRTDF